MKRFAWPLLVLASCGAPSPEPIQGDLSSVLERGIREGTGAFDHGPWDEILSKYALENGRRFDYAGLKKEEGILTAYLLSLADGRSRKPSRSGDRGALHQCVQRLYRPNHSRSRFGERGFRHRKHPRHRRCLHPGSARGGRLPPQPRQHRAQRLEAHVPRPEAAFRRQLRLDLLSSASRCDAFEGERVEEQLESAATNALGSPDYVAIEAEALLLTKILEWYGADFVNPEYHGSEKSLPAFVSKYAERKRPAFPRREGA